MKNTENLWYFSVFERERSNTCFKTKVLWRNMTIQLRKLNEYKIQSIGLSRFLLKDLNYLDNNAQIMPRQKENVSNYKTSIWRKRSISTNHFIRANKCVKIRMSNSKKMKIMITLLIGKQDENGTKSSREICRILRLRRPHHCRIPHGQIEIHGGALLQSLTKGIEWFFLQHAVSDCWNVVPTSRRGLYTEDTSVACNTNTAVFLQAQITFMLVAWGSGSRPWRLKSHCIIFSC